MREEFEDLLKLYKEALYAEDARVDFFLRELRRTSGRMLSLRTNPYLDNL